MNLGDDLHHSHDAFFIHGMIEEPEIAYLHGAHVFLRERVPDTVPFLAFWASPYLIIPGKGSRFCLEQPKGHAVLSRTGSHPSMRAAATMAPRFSSCKKTTSMSPSFGTALNGNA